MGIGVYVYTFTHVYIYIMCVYVLESYTLYVCDYKNNRQGLLLLLLRVYESIKFCKSTNQATKNTHMNYK